MKSEEGLVCVTGNCGLSYGVAGKRCLLQQQALAFTQARPEQMEPPTLSYLLYHCCIHLQPVDAPSSQQSPAMCSRRVQDTSEQKQKCHLHLLSALSLEPACFLLVQLADLFFC